MSSERRYPNLDELDEGPIVERAKRLRTAIEGSGRRPVCLWPRGGALFGIQDCLRGG